VELDIFLSHSWHASWRLKYISLLFYFNIDAASVLGMCAGIACYLVRHQRQQQQPHHPVACSELGRGQACDVELWSFLVGGGTFLAVLFSWHHVAALLPRRCGGRVLFLDKVCINQTDPEKKAQGIASLGGILARCDTFLVAWDATYFSRLWCIYEMSAFKALPNGTVAFVPLSNGGLVVALLAGELAADLLCAYVDNWLAFFSLLAVDRVYTACWFLTVLACAPMLREHAQDLGALDGQLANFAVERAECFCCKVGHRHPETGDPLACDRRHVYAAIARRQDEDDLQKALQDFDKEIRTCFKYDIRAAGWGSKVPYSMVLSVGVWSGLASLDWSLAFERPLWLAFADAVFWAALVFPLIVGTTMELLLLVPFYPRSCVMKRLMEVCIASFFAALLWALPVAHRKMTEHGPEHLCASLGLQAAGVWLLYCRPGFRTRCIRRIRTTSDLMPDLVSPPSSAASSSSSSSRSSSRGSSAGSPRARRGSSSAGSSADPGPASTDGS